MNIQTFGEMLKAIRKDRELTIEKLANKIGKTKAYISDIERGACKAPPKETVKKLAEALEFNYADLWTIAAVERANIVLKKEGIDLTEDILLSKKNEFAGKGMAQTISQFMEANKIQKIAALALTALPLLAPEIVEASDQIIEASTNLSGYIMLTLLFLGFEVFA